MAAMDSFFRERDGKLYMQVTPGRAQALLEALDVALSSDRLDKRVKAVVTGQRKLLAVAASGNAVERNPACWVYILKDRGPRGEKLTKIGHARNVDRRLARKTDRPTGLVLVAAWRFASVLEAMNREGAVRKTFKAYKGDGGTEWLEASAYRVLTHLTAAWGEPNRKGPI
jgi:hypothetical protein